MKVAFAVIIVLLLGGGYYLYTSNSNTVTTDPFEPTEEMHSDMEAAETTENDPEVPAEDTMVDSGTALDSAESSTEPAAEGSVKEFTIDSFNFGYSMEEIRVQAGDTVTINLTNSDGFHDWVVDEFDAATEMIRAGETTSVTFVADAAGTYEYYCSVGSHRAQGMVGTLIVE